MKDAVDTIQPSEEISQLPFNAIDYLAGIKGREVSKARRIEITASCKDCNYIPKVSAAGKVLKNKVGQTYQIMHNGIKVVVDGYYGPWVTELIKKLQGHHEPQEEKVFYELAKLFQPNTTMIELGSYWAYYSLWFHKAVKGGFNICCEPDPRNTEIGQINFALNGYNEGVKFINAAAGQDDGKVISFDAEHVADKVRVPIRSVDSLVKEYKIERLEVLHMDVQGAEYDALLGAAETIKSGRLRFVFVSTHHYLISRNPDIHNKCIE
ncbi:MAG: FkbM family methyltransferase, partial [Candidatus Saccharimonadales bacterium]